MDRKYFIKTVCCFCAGEAALVTLLQSCASTNYFAQSTSTGNQITIKKSEFLTKAGNKPKNRKYILIKPQQFNFPICIYKMSEDNYSAVLMQCTHKGCELQPNAESLICPCHGSEFTRTGVVRTPPADENLKAFMIKSDNEYIYIEL